MQAVLEYTEQALQAAMHEEVEKKPKARQRHSAASVFQPQIGLNITWTDHPGISLLTSVLINLRALQRTRWRVRDKN